MLDYLHAANSTPRVLAFWLVAFASPGVLLTACGAGTEAAPAHESRATAKSRNAAVDPAPSTVGGPCDGPPFSQSDCAAGLTCGFGPGGYCTAFCASDQDCPGKGVCTSTVRAGRLCMSRCESDADCRADEGWVCDPQWGTCFLPGYHIPRLAACEAELPARAGSWSRPSVVSVGEAAGRYSIEPAATQRADGSIVVAYMAMRTITEPSRIVTAVVDIDGRVSNPVIIESGKVHHFDPWLATGPDGTLHLVWLGHDGHGDQNAVIGYATSSDGRTWSEPITVHDADVDCPNNVAGCLDKPMIAIAPRGARHSGRIYVTYFGLGDGGSLRMVTSDDGGRTFGESVRAGTGAYGDVWIDGRGGVHVVYVDGAEGANRFGDPSNHVFYASSDDGGASFSEPERVSAKRDSVPFYFSNATLAVHADGTRRFVAYPAGTPDGAWSMYLATSRDGRTWSRVEVPGAACPNRMTPTLAVGHQGRLHLTWTEGGAGTGGFMHAICKRDGASCEAPTRVSGAPFADYQLLRHDTPWLGEYNALVVARDTLHAVWAQPIAGNPVASRVHHAWRPLGRR